MTDTLCPLPWMHLSQRNNGHFRVCCHSNPTVEKGLLRGDDGNFLHASSANFTDVRNSPTLKDIRKHMLENRWHPQCSSCRSEEHSGIHSARLQALDRWNESWDRETSIQKTASDGGIVASEHPLFSYDVRLGNVCNLKCRMCGPMDSRTWYSDYQKLYNIQHFADTHGNVVFTDQNKNDPYLWFEDPFFWNELFQQKDHIRSLYLVGGEPLLIDEHFQFLRRLVSSGVAGGIELIYNSNLTRLDKTMIDLWRHFREVNIGVSIDGTAEINDYIRGPVSFATLENNITTLDQAGGNVKMWLAPTVQIYNVSHIPDFLRWVLKKNFNFLGRSTHHGLALFNPLHRPVFLNIQALPQAAKAAIVQDYESFFAELEKYKYTPLGESVNSTVQFLRGILQYMNSADTSQHLPRFLQHTKTLDDLRSQKFANVHPRLHALLQEAVTAEARI